MGNTEVQPLPRIQTTIQQDHIPVITQSHNDTPNPNFQLIHRMQAVNTVNTITISDVEELEQHNYKSEKYPTSREPQTIREPQTHREGQRTRSILKQANTRTHRPNNHQQLLELPDVKPPAKKQFVVKKTKEGKAEGIVSEAEVEELENLVALSKPIPVDIQNFNGRGRTAPLATDESLLQEFRKTRKCRVSRML